MKKIIVGTLLFCSPLSAGIDKDSGQAPEFSSDSYDYNIDTEWQDYITRFLLNEIDRLHHAGFMYNYSGAAQQRSKDAHMKLVKLLELWLNSSM